MNIQKEFRVESLGKTGRSSICNKILCSCRCNIKATRLKRKCTYMFKTVFSLCWWHNDNYKHKM